MAATKNMIAKAIQEVLVKERNCSTENRAKAVAKVTLEMGRGLATSRIMAKAETEFVPAMLPPLRRGRLLPAKSHTDSGDKTANTPITMHKKALAQKILLKQVSRP
jgi:hypothetical protein